MVKLEKDKERRFKMNNWVKFFVADALLSIGFGIASSLTGGIGIFCVFGGIAIAASIVFEEVK